MGVSDEMSKKAPFFSPCVCVTPPISISLFFFKLFTSFAFASSGLFFPHRILFSQFDFYSSPIPIRCKFFPLSTGLKKNQPQKSTKDKNYHHSPWLEDIRSFTYSQWSPCRAPSTSSFSLSRAINFTDMMMRNYCSEYGIFIWRRWRWWGS